MIFSSDGSDPAADLDHAGADSRAGRLAAAAAGSRIACGPIQLHRLRRSPASPCIRPRGKRCATGSRPTAASSAAGDTLLLYVTDHGEQNKKDLTNNTIVLWGNESLPVDELRDLLEPAQPRRARRDADVAVLLRRVRQLRSFGPTPDWPPAATSAATSPPPPTAPPTAAIPENRGLDGVGHSHHFFDALDALGRMSEAEKRVLVTDDSPDVPHTTSDFYLQQLLAGARRRRAGASRTEVADELRRRMPSASAASGSRRSA